MNPIAAIRPNIRTHSLTAFGSLEEVSGQHSNLGAVPRLELSHDMVKMNFYRVLAHIELVSDLFVGLSKTDFLDNLHLSFGQQDTRFRCRLFLVVIVDEAAGGYKGSLGLHQSHGFDGHVEGQAGRNVTSRTALQRAHDVVEVIDIGHDHDRNGRCGGFKEFEIGDAGFVAIVDDDYDDGGGQRVRFL